MDILVVIEDNNGKMHRMGLESISAAQSIAKDKEFSIGVLVMGANADELSNEASQYDVQSQSFVKFYTFRIQNLVFEVIS